METQTIEMNDIVVVECVPGGGQLTCEADALELVAACGEAGASRLLIHADALSHDFFHLRTGLAGKVLLKFDIYSIRAAVVAPEEMVKQGRFYDLALEANRGRQLHFSSQREEALNWLVSLHDG